MGDFCTRSAICLLPALGEEEGNDDSSSVRARRLSSHLPFADIPRWNTGVSCEVVEMAIDFEFVRRFLSRWYY